MAVKNLKDVFDKYFNREKLASVFSKAQLNSAPISILPSQGASDLLGIDIGPDRIKLLKFNTHSTPHTITTLAMADVPAGAFVKDEIKDPAGIGIVLRGLLKQYSITDKFAALAIPRSLAIIKNISVDKRLQDSDLESRAWIEANRHFPDLIGDIYLDFTITGPALLDPDKKDLLLVACRKEHIKPYLELMQYGGLTAKVVDVNCYALERALNLIVKDDAKLETVALLNVNTSQSSLIVLNKQQLIHAHDQTFDGKRLLYQVDEYRKTKQVEGMDEVPLSINDAAYHQLLQGSFLSHLRHTVHFFYSSRPNISIQKIYLSGDCSSIPDLSAFIEKEIGIPAQLANPFANMEAAGAVEADELQKYAASLMLCSGLALSQIKE